MKKISIETSIPEIMEIVESLNNEICPICKSKLSWEKTEIERYPIPFGLAAKYIHKLECKLCQKVFVHYEQHLRVR